MNVGDVTDDCALVLAVTGTHVLTFGGDGVYFTVRYLSPTSGRLVDPTSSADIREALRDLDERSDLE